MSDKDRLAEEILDHLQLYKELGVRWTDASRRAVPQAAAGPASGKPVRSAPAETTPPRVAVPEPTLYPEPALPAESLEDVRKSLGDCRRCKLAGGRTHLVFGSGNPKAELMFVGEAPGADEDAQGLPFVGRAGQLLTRIIEAIEMKRDEVYICNVLKCRPPNNRNPEPDEIEQCEPFLFRQIAAIKPKVICALGTFGAQTLLRTREPISRLRGRFFDYRGTKLMPTFHPAYLLHNPGEKRKVWEDVQKIRDYLQSLR